MALEVAADNFIATAPFSPRQRVRIASRALLAASGLVSDLAVVVSARAATYGDVEVAVFDATGHETLIAVQRDQLEAAL